MVTLTVYFEAPWWVGVVEMEADGELRVARQVFGSEPPNEVVYLFVLRELADVLARARLATACDTPPPRPLNPKRAAREAGRLTEVVGLSTRAQEALRLEREAHKQARQVKSKAEREHEAEVKRAKARAKALAKRRGH